MMTPEGEILRYKRFQIIGHWINVTAFLLLLGTGFLIYFAPLSPHASHFSRTLHRVGAVLLLFGPIFYYFGDRRDFFHLLKASFTYDKNDLMWLAKMPLYFFGKAEDLPPQGDINAGQRVHHALTIIFYNFVAWSGLLLWFGGTNIPQDWFLISLMVHDISMTVLTVLMIGHMYFSFVYGAMSGMIRGRISATYAQIEHPLWLKELEKSGKVEPK